MKNWKRTKETVKCSAFKLTILQRLALSLYSMIAIASQYSDLPPSDKKNKVRNASNFAKMLNIHHWTSIFPTNHTLASRLIKPVCLSQERIGRALGCCTFQAHLYLSPAHYWLNQKSSHGGSIDFQTTSICVRRFVAIWWDLHKLFSQSLWLASCAFLTQSPT